MLKPPNRRTATLSGWFKAKFTSDFPVIDSANIDSIVFSKILLSHFNRQWSTSTDKNHDKDDAVVDLCTDTTVEEDDNDGADEEEHGLPNPPSRSNSIQKEGRTFEVQPPIIPNATKERFKGTIECVDMTQDSDSDASYEF